MVDSILDVKNLSGGYDDLLVVRDISLKIHSGQAVSITGRNGVGKSTLLKLIFGNLLDLYVFYKFSIFSLKTEILGKYLYIFQGFFDA